MEVGAIEIQNGCDYLLTALKINEEGICTVLII